MGDSRTLQQLLDDAAARADIAPITATTHVTQSQATTWVNQAIGKLRGRIIKEYDEDYFTKFESPTIATVAGTDLYPNPTDFFKLLGIEFSTDNEVTWLDAARLNFGDRNRFGTSQSRWSATSRPRYKLFGAGLLWRPVPDGVYKFRRIYAPTLLRLSALSDTFEFYNGWDRFVGAFVAELIAIKRDESPAPHRAAQADAWADICEEVRVRDAAEPMRVRDSEGYSTDALSDFDDEEAI